MCKMFTVAHPKLYYQLATSLGNKLEQCLVMLAELNQGWQAGE